MKNFKLSFKKLNLNTHGRLFGWGSSPEADWKIIFILTLVLAVSFVILSAFIFIKIDKGEIFVVKKSLDQETKTLDMALLKETVSYYEAKAREFSRIKSVVIPAVDPSL
mgnify:CR=1 FL=1